MTISTKFSVRIADFYFDEEPKNIAVDLIRRLQSSTPTAEGRCTPFCTVVVDLSPSEEWLIAHVRNNTRYEIKRAAERDHLTYSYWDKPGQNVVAEFCDFFDHFARLRKRPRISRSRFRTLADWKVVDLSMVSQGSGEPLVWHAFYRCKERVRMLESPSRLKTTADTEERNLFGRANRYHHWQDMMRFKAEGILTYDLGGWAPNARDPEIAGINRFKEGFGGRIVENYNYQRPITVKGKMALHIFDLMQSLRGAREKPS